MDEQSRTEEALWRYAVLGAVLSEDLRRGERRKRLREIALKRYVGPDGKPRRVRWKTLEEWFYRYRRGGLDGLKPQPRSDRGTVRAIAPELVELVCALKREDPGRSAPLILRELELAGRIAAGSVSAKTIQRVLRARDLSGPRMELDRPERHRWRAAYPGELWQADALHGPKLLDPETGELRRAIIFALLDDHSRVLTHIAAGFHETEEVFLRVLAGAIARRGVPRVLYPDRGPCFTGHGLRLVCGKLGIRLLHAPPRDGPSKGKIERVWRTIRARVLDRLDAARVTTLDQLNLRLASWVDAEYHNTPHAGLDGRTPAEVWDAGSDHVRWLDPTFDFDAVFVAQADRHVRNDSTIELRGVSYEVPSHFRRRKVHLRYSLLHPGRVSLVEEASGLEVPLRPTDPEGNASRPRGHRGGRDGDDGAAGIAARVTPRSPRPKTGLNAVELVLARVAGKRRTTEER